jgi:hypothetical protein
MILQKEMLKVTTIENAGMWPRGISVADLQSYLGFGGPNHCLEIFRSYCQTMRRAAKAE